MEKKIWTKEEIRNNIQNDQAWLERAIVAIYDRQTEDEKAIQDAKERNNVGFNKPDSGRGSYFAKWIKDGRHLSGKHLEKARKMMIKYSGQLEKIANGAC